MMRDAVSTRRRRTLVIQPSPRIGTPSRTGRLKSTLIRAVRPQLSVAASDQAMTSSRIVQMIPPWAMPSQPWKRSGRLSSVQQRSPSTWRSRWIPCSLRAPQAKQRCGATSMISPLDRDVTIRPAASCWRSRSAAVDPSSTGSVRLSRVASRTSDVKVPYLACLGVDEVLARRDLLDHQNREDRVGRIGMLDLGTEERPRGRVHRRLPELIGIHLAEALEALDRDVLAVHLLDDPVPLLLGLGVFGDLPGRHAIQRRLGDVQVAVLDDLRHEPVEEREEQGPDMGAVDVGVGHDDDPVVAELRDVEAVADPLEP